MSFDMNKLMQQAQQMQAQMAQAQEEVASEVVEASAGGGMVKVKVSGAMELKEIWIDVPALTPEAVSGGGAGASAAPVSSAAAPAAGSATKWRPKSVMRGAVWVVKLKRAGVPSKAPSAVRAAPPTTSAYRASGDHSP